MKLIISNINLLCAVVTVNLATVLAAWNVSCGAALCREDTWEYQSAVCLIVISSSTPPHNP